MYAAASTTVTSQNGWPASASPSAIDIIAVAVPLSGGRSFTINVARKAALPLVTMIQWWDVNIEKVTTLGSYNYRPVVGYTDVISNHGSGTAVDINAASHPLAKVGTVTSAQHAAISAKAAELGLKWGGDYHTRKDEMHIEISSPMDRVFTAVEGGVKTAVTTYWWVTLIGVGTLAAAALWRHRFGEGAP